MRGLTINDLHAAARACERCSVIDARHDELASREWWELRARLLRTATAVEESSEIEAVTRAMEEVTRPLVDEIERLQWALHRTDVERLTALERGRLS